VLLKTDNHKGKEFQKVARVEAASTRDTKELRFTEPHPGETAKKRGSDQHGIQGMGYEKTLLLKQRIAITP